MTDHDALAGELRNRIDLMASDLAQRIDPPADSDVQRREGVRDKWAAAYAGAFSVDAGPDVASGRAQPSLDQWCAARTREAAAAWVFGTAVVRFCEDNRLVEPLWFAGPGARLAEAVAAQNEYFRTHPPTHTDREYLGTAIAHFTRMPATRALFGRGCALRLVSPSIAGAHELLEFWREVGDNGVLLRSFADLGADPMLLLRLHEHTTAAGLAARPDHTPDITVQLGVISVADMLAQFASVVGRLRAGGVATLERLAA